HDQRLVGLPLAVEPFELQRARDARDPHAAARVDPVDGEQDVAPDGVAGVGERTGEALDQSEPDRFAGGRSRLAVVDGASDRSARERKQARAGESDRGAPTDQPTDAARDDTAPAP